MKRLWLVTVIALAMPNRAMALECADFWTWLENGCRRVVDTYEHGDNGLLVSGYSWHLPGSWPAERRAMENQNAWGGGWAHSVEHPNSDTDTVFFLVFEDSHRQAQFNLGYGWTTYWGEREKLQPGLGFTAMIIQRPDIASGVPVPVVLPLLALRYQKVTLLSAFVPKLNGGINHGDILYFFGKIDLN